MENTALLIVDVQKVMFSYKNSSVHNADTVLANIKQMLVICLHKNGHLIKQ